MELSREFEKLELSKNDAQALYDLFIHRLLKFTANSLGNFYVMDVTLMSSPPAIMRLKSALKTTLGFHKVPAYEEEGTKVRDMTIDKTIVKKVDAVYYKAEDINGLISAINKALKSKEEILTAQQILEVGDTLTYIQTGAD